MSYLSVVLEKLAKFFREGDFLVCPVLLSIATSINVWNTYSILMCIVTFHFSSEWCICNCIQCKISDLAIFKTSTEVNENQQSHVQVQESTRQRLSKNNKDAVALTEIVEALC